MLNGAGRSDRASLLFHRVRSLSPYRVVERGRREDLVGYLIDPAHLELQGGGWVEASVDDPASVLNEVLGYTHDEHRT